MAVCPASSLLQKYQHLQYLGTPEPTLGILVLDQVVPLVPGPVGPPVLGQDEHLFLGLVVPLVLDHIMPLVLDLDEPLQLLQQCLRVTTEGWEQLMSRNNSALSLFTFKI